MREARLICFTSPHLRKGSICGVSLAHSTDYSLWNSVATEATASRVWLLPEGCQCFDLHLYCSQSELVRRQEEVHLLEGPGLPATPAPAPLEPHPCSPHQISPALLDLCSPNSDPEWGSEAGGREHRLYVNRTEASIVLRPWVSSACSNPTRLHTT